MAEVLRRHSVVFASSHAWDALLARRPELADDALLVGWARHGRPLVVASGTQHATRLPLGLPLPARYGKRRVQVWLESSELVHARPPPRLSEALQAAPVSWRPCIERLLELEPRTRVFGSLAFQHLTQLPYLSAASDLDLLWPVPAPLQAQAPRARGRQALDQLLAGIEDIARWAPMPIDGELLGVAGGVHWRELLQGEVRDVMVKAQAGPRIMRRLDFLAGRAS